MSNYKTAPTPVITCLKLSKDNEGSTVDPMLFKRLVGSLMYLTATRPDIMYGVSLISRFMESPKESHSLLDFDPKSDGFFQRRVDFLF